MEFIIIFHILKQLKIEIEIEILYLFINKCNTTNF